MILFHATPTSLKHWLLTLIYCTSLLANAHESCSLAFVHLGEELPDYLPIALKQARLFNPDIPIYLIANKCAFQKAHNTPKTVICICCEDLPQSNAHTMFLKNSQHNNSFRNGFWRKATERLFYVEELMHSHELTNVIHMEYDNMLYVDLHELMPTLKQYSELGIIFDNDSRTIPNFIFIAQPSSMTHLATYIALQANRAINDMHIIALYKNNYPHMVKSLPVIPNSYTNFQKKVADPTLYSNNIDSFQSLFDGAAIGQYLGGIDPRNGHSAPGFINRDAAYDVSHFQFDWQLDEHERNIPYLKYQGEKYRINNLHIHSKKLENFTSTN